MDAPRAVEAVEDGSVATTRWWHLRPYARTVALTASPAVVVLLLFAHPLNPHFVEWFQANVGFQWVSIAGLVTVCLSGGYAAAQYHFPEVREFAFALFFAGIYMLDITAGYSANLHHARLVSESLWWAIPILVAAWTRATFRVAEAVRSAEVSVPERRPLWNRIKPRSQKEWLIWGGAFAFSVIGSWPGLGLTFDQTKPLNWNGYSYKIHAPYFAFTAFALVAMLTGAVTMDRAWGARPPWISKSRAEYASATRVAAWALFGVTIVLLASAAQIWPEALVDGLIAVYVYWFVMRVISTHHYADLRTATSLPRRATGGAAIILILFTGVAASGLPAIRAAVLGAIVSGAWPLIPTIDRALHGRRRIARLRARAGAVANVASAATAAPIGLPPAEHAEVVEPREPASFVLVKSQELTSSERSAITAFLEDEAWPAETIVSATRRAELATATLSELTLLSRLDHPIRDLVDMRGRYAASSKTPDEVYAFLDAFSLIQYAAEGLDGEARIQALSKEVLDLIRRSVAARRAKLKDGRVSGSRLKGDPDPYLVLEAECAERVCGLEKSDPLRAKYAPMFSAYESWRVGLAWETSDEAQARRKLQQERGVPTGRASRKNKTSTKNVRRRRVDEAGAVLLKDWRRDLERAATRPAPLTDAAVSET